MDVAATAGVGVSATLIVGLGVSAAGGRRSGVSVGSGVSVESGVSVGSGVGVLVARGVGDCG